MPRPFLSLQIPPESADLSSIGAVPGTGTQPLRRTHNRDSSARALQAGNSMAEEKKKSETLLVVDDDVRVVELLQITLGGRGYNVLTAYDGETGLEMAESHIPDLVVLDVRLPRIGGFEVLQKIRARDSIRHVPVVLISANAATESRLQGLKLGADDYITKPFSPRELILRIRRILDRSRDRNLLLLKNEVLETEVRRSRDSLLEMQQELGSNLTRISGLINRVLELDQAAPIEDVLERFVVAAVSGLDFGRTALLTPDDTSQDYVPRVSRGIDDNAVDRLSFATDGFLMRVLCNVARPMRVDEFEDFPEAQDEVGRLSAAGLSLVVPAFSGSELRGILVLGERDRATLLTRYDLKVLEILGHSIATALRNAQAFDDSQRTFFETTARLIASVEDRYPYMSGHSKRVRDISLSIGQRIGLSENELEILGYGALLHGLGQLERYDDLMTSSRVLSDEERHALRRESAARSDALLGNGARARVKAILKHHHEDWDGTGYPDNLEGQDIPIGARIVTLANAFDALVHERPHRPAYSNEDALRILVDRAGTQFDPELVPVLAEIVEANAEREVSV